MRNSSEKNCRVSQDTHNLYLTNFSSRKSCRLRDNVQIYCGGAHNNIVEVHTTTLWRCTQQHNTPHLHARIPKATNSHSEYVILIAFPLQQRLQELASGLRYAYIACLVSVSKDGNAVRGFRCHNR